MSKLSDAGGPLGPGSHPAMASAGQPAQSSEHHETGRRSHEDTSQRHRLTIGSMALLLFAVGTAAVGQVMLKHGMQVATARAAHSGGSLVASAATSPWALSRVPLSVAYPFNALGYLGILTASVLVLHERANVLTWAGSLLVVSGLIIVVLARP